MNRFARIALTVPVLSLGLALAGCESFDPTSILDMEIFNTKKKLPGDRRAVFPEGTPGVPQGVPQELVKGYQAPPEPGQESESQASAQAQPAESRGQAERGIHRGRGHGSAAGAIANPVARSARPAAAVGRRRVARLRAVLGRRHRLA